MRFGSFGILAALVLAGCDRPAPVAAPAAPAAPPAMVTGEFQDDYGIRYRITATEWLQLPRGRYHVLRWNPEGMYLIAQNDSTNRGDPGRFTRIDWLPLSGMAPWDWAFCLSAYDALTAAAAEAVLVAKRDTPKTGCNGFPFSRMKRMPVAPTGGSGGAR